MSIATLLVVSAMSSTIAITPEKPVPGDGLVRVSIDSQDGDQVYWLITSPRGRDFEALGNKLIFAAGARPGEVQGDVTIIN